MPMLMALNSAQLVDVFLNALQVVRQPGMPTCEQNRHRMALRLFIEEIAG